MNPSQMTAGQINKALDKLDRESSRITDEFIETGRGHERPSEYLRLDDPLSRRARENSDARSALRNEIEQRYGPGAPHRLPTGRGFGPRKGEFGGTDNEPMFVRDELQWRNLDDGYEYAGTPHGGYEISRRNGKKHLEYHGRDGEKGPRFPDGSVGFLKELAQVHHNGFRGRLGPDPVNSGFRGLDDSQECSEGRCDDCREPECCCRCHSRYAHCSCGAGYTKPEWDALPFVGRVRTVSKGHLDPVRLIESRTCRYCKDSAVEEFLA